MILCIQGVDFEFIEHDPYNKSDEWLKINPRGMVPVVIHDDKAVYESQVCLEFIEDLFPEKAPHLLPADPYLKARARLMADHISKKIVAHFFPMLLKQDQAEQEKEKESILAGIAELMRDADACGPFLLGAEPTLPDIMLASFALRINVVLRHYRNFVVPGSAEAVAEVENGALYQKYHQWFRAISELKSFKSTLVEDERLIDSLKKYANNTAKSQVAVAVQKGASAASV